ncbi:MAG: polysaccharide deacetylase [Lachnospiraceae bacterium]|nr:polysaccharide deacetylase [Lachnospiraceae bacterium]
MSRYTVILVILTALLAVGIGFLLFFLLRDRKPSVPPESFPSVDVTEEGNTSDPTDVPDTLYSDILKKASVTAAMYDYDGAMEYVKKEVPGYEEIPELAAFIQECKANQGKLVKWADNSQITHIFYHTLVADPEKAFSSFKRNDYNEVMTTIEEFNKITESMYAKGYVMVHMEDIAKIVEQPDGTKKMQYQPIYLPAGKIPFVLSVDDVSYYEYMNNTGFATRLIVDDDGRIVNEMDIYEEAVPKQTDGRTGGPLLKTDEYGRPVVASTKKGDFDVVPLIDRFVEAHPDFSYRGAKGTIALTGYNGILGYRTSYFTYGKKDDAWMSKYSKWEKDWQYYNPDIEADRAKAKAVADAMKKDGWKFASHTWGHMNMQTVVDKNTGTIGHERFQRDTSWWEEEVKPLLGDVDIIIFAFGADIGSWKGYTDTNEAFLYLKSKGFNYFCNVDGSTPAWVQLNKSAGGSGYLRMGRRNLDGLLMFKQIVNPDKHILDDLFNAKEVFDHVHRPIPVSGVKVPEGTDLNHLFD